MFTITITHRLAKCWQLFLLLLSVLAHFCGFCCHEEQFHFDASVLFENDVEDGGYGGSYVALVDDESSLSPTRPTTAAELLLHVLVLPKSPKKPAQSALRDSDVDEWTRMNDLVNAFATSQIHRCMSPNIAELDEATLARTVGRKPARRFTSTPAPGILRNSDKMLRQIPGGLFSQAAFSGLTQTERRAIHYGITKNTAYLSDESLEACRPRTREFVAATSTDTFGVWANALYASSEKFSEPTKSG